MRPARCCPTPTHRSRILSRDGRMGQDESTRYYYAQVLGDDGWTRLFPDARPEEQRTWSKVPPAVPDYRGTTQDSDGSWNSGSVGPIVDTRVYRTILQLENGAPPLCQG